MSNFRQLDQNVPKIIIDNEDEYYNIFLRFLIKSGLLEEGKNIQQLKCKKAPPKPTIGNRLKKFEFSLNIYEGDYHINWEGSDFTLSVERGEAKIVSECR